MRSQKSHLTSRRMPVTVGQFSDRNPDMRLSIGLDLMTATDAIRSAPRWHCIGEWRGSEPHKESVVN